MGVRSDLSLSRSRGRRRLTYSSGVPVRINNLSHRDTADRGTFFISDRDGDSFSLSRDAKCRALRESEDKQGASDNQSKQRTNVTHGQSSCRARQAPSPAPKKATPLVENPFHCTRNRWRGKGGG